MQRIITKYLFLTEWVLFLERLRFRSSAFQANPKTFDLNAQRAILRLAAFCLIAVSLAFLTIGVTNALLPSGSHDLQWTPVRDLLAGVNPYENFMQWQDDGHELTPPHFLNQSPSYPASVYVMLAPLGLLDWQVAKITWLTLNLGLIVAILAGLQRQFPVRQPVVLSLIICSFLCSTPLRASLGAGQINLLSIAAFIWAYNLAQRQDRISHSVSGALLAIAWAKYSLTFPLTLIFINQKNWRPIVVASVVHAILTLIAAFKLQMLPHEFFFSSVAVVLMGDGTGFVNISAVAMLLHLPTAVTMAVIVFSLCLTGYVVSRARHIKPLVLISFLAMVSYALFYHHNYDFVVLIFLAWCIGSERLSIPVVIASLCILSLSWSGVWLTHEIAPSFGGVAAYLIEFVELIQVIAFYATLLLIAASLHRRTSTEKATDGVLAF